MVSPALSTNVPKAPAGTPATFHSPTKSLMLREATAASSMQAGDGWGVPPSREITMSPGHRFWVPSATSPGPPASPNELGKGFPDGGGGGGGDDGNPNGGGSDDGPNGGGVGGKEGGGGGDDDGDDDDDQVLHSWHHPSQAS